MRRLSSSGQLLSLDAVRGRDLVPSTRRLLRGKSEADGGFSTWDASGIFFEMLGLGLKEQASARTLVLLYAADLYFRLRWEILPALESGQTVIAAPYVETGIAFGRALGIPRRWTTAVFRFAPKPDAAFWMSGTPLANAAPTTGFLEYCSEILPEHFVDKFVRHFETLEHRSQCRSLVCP